MRKAIMATDNPTGICSTCKFGTGCELLEPGRLPVLQCEQFEPPERVERQAPVRPARTKSDAAPAEPPTDGLLGLCRSCGARADCSFVRPESGVWHCEEYV